VFAQFSGKTWLNQAMGDLDVNAGYGTPNHVRLLGHNEHDP
jgi:hypothetical protein